MLAVEMQLRGYELCSTSYNTESSSRATWRCAVKFSRTHQCKRKRNCLRSTVLAAGPERSNLTEYKQSRADLAEDSSEDETDLAEYRPARTELVRGSAWDTERVRRRISVDDAKNGRWADDFEESNDWHSFFGDDGLSFEDPALDDTHDGLRSGSRASTETLLEAHKAIREDLQSPAWRARHPNFTSPVPVPRIKKYMPDIPDPELVPHRDWDEFALRAWVEKRRQKERTDAAWKLRQAEVGRYSVLNVTEENDTRLEPGWTTVPRTWSHEEIWDLILNSGQSAHPDDVKSLKIQDPEAKADYFVEGVHYIPETEEYLAEIGHWWENESEPDLKPEVTLASEFSDLEVDGSSSVDADQDNADNENDDDTAGPDDDATQLGRVFGTQF